jgi:hypothetical protein
MVHPEQIGKDAQAGSLCERIQGLIHPMYALITKQEEMVWHW